MQQRPLMDAGLMIYPLYDLLEFHIVLMIFLPISHYTENSRTSLSTVIDKKLCRYKIQRSRRPGQNGP